MQSERFLYSNNVTLFLGALFAEIIPCGPLIYPAAQIMVALHSWLEQGAKQNRCESLAYCSAVQPQNYAARIDRGILSGALSCPGFY